MNEEIDYKNFKPFFLKVARPYLKWFVAMLFVGVYSSIHSVLQPYILKVLLDSASHAKEGQFLALCMPPGILLIILGFIITFIWRFYNYIPVIIENA